MAVQAVEPAALGREVQLRAGRLAAVQLAARAADHRGGLRGALQDVRLQDVRLQDADPLLGVHLLAGPDRRGHPDD